MHQTFRCPECGAELPTAGGLADHVAEQHAGARSKRGRQEKCPACSMEFPTDESLQEHMQKAHGQKLPQ